MSGLIAWFASRKVVANLLMIVIIGLGVLAAFNVKREIMPEFSLDIITVTVPYRGAAPSEVEEGVCFRVEDAIQGLDGVKRVTCTAAEGAGITSVEVVRGFDTRRLLDDIKTRIDSISTFPRETERPIIQEVVSRLQVINVSISGDTDELTLKRLGERVRDELTAIDGISQVELKGARPFEVSIEVSEQALRRFNLTFDDIAQAVRASSLDLPAGSVKTENGEILLRTKGQAYSGRDFENIAIRTTSDGTRLRLADVAQVIDGFEETEQSSRLDGKPAVLIQVFRAGREGAPEVAALVHKYVEEAQPRMAPGIKLSTWQDSSKFLESREDLLVNNAFQGFVLVCIVLALFLRPRLAFWVAAGIPVSFLGAIALMPALGVSINLISLFAFIIVEGIVADDAIVIGENAFERQKELGNGLAGAVRGAQEVAAPVTFGVLTTVAAFMPFLFVPGKIGNLARAIPLVAVPVLLFSLVESQLIFPSHISHWHPHRAGERQWLPGRLWDGFFNLFSAGVDFLITRGYGPFLGLALRWRYVTLSVAIVVLMLAVGLIGGQFVPTVFFPQIESDNVLLLLTMPQGTPAHVTAEAVRSMESTVLKFAAAVEKREGKPLYRHVLASVGEQPSAGGVLFDRTPVGSNIAEINMELVPSSDRPMSGADVAAKLREAMPPIPGATAFSIHSSLSLAGSPIDIMVAGSDIEQLRGVSNEIRDKLTKYPGVVDIADSFRGGKPEVKLAIRPEAEGLGLSLQDLARQVRQAFFGEETQRIQRGRDDLRVMIRYPESERQSLGNLEQMRIRTVQGAEVPFETVASVEMGEGFSEIRRVDRQRVIDVTAGIDEAAANATLVLNDLESDFLPSLIAKYPGVSYSLEGQHAEQMEFIEGISGGYVIALIAIYALIAIPLNSYSQPLLVMSAIPFGLVGAVVGHYIEGRPLSFLSIFGMVAVTGVIVNDSLVLIHYINEHRHKHDSFIDVVRSAGVARLRPILLTSLTAAAGVTPMMLETSLQAQFLIPMAISLAYGVLFATAVTLVLLPAGYMILDDVAGLFRRGRSRNDEPVESRTIQEPQIMTAPSVVLETPAGGRRLDAAMKERIRQKARDFTMTMTLQNQIMDALRGTGLDTSPASDPVIAPAFARFRFNVQSKRSRKILGRVKKLDLGFTGNPPLIEVEDSTITIDVPRGEKREVVPFSRVIAALPPFVINESRLLVPLGVDSEGNLRSMNLDASGSGHCMIIGEGSENADWLRAAIVSLMVTNTPETLRLELADAQALALDASFSRAYLWHASGSAADAVERMAQEMERRHQEFRSVSVKDLESWRACTGKSMPHIVCVLPEIGSAMKDHRRRAFEDGVVGLSAKARAAGIHMILATRYPNREILSPRIQACVSTRLCFRTASEQESLIALQVRGAERLTGAGDMFYNGGGQLWRLQAAYLTENDAEVRAAMNQCLNAAQEP